MKVMEYEELEVIYKSKADALAAIQKEKRGSMVKVEFNVKNRYHAVYLTQKQLLEAEEKAKAQGITIQQYYKEKYS